MFIKIKELWYFWFCCSIQKALANMSGKNRLMTEKKKNGCVQWVVVSKGEYFWSQLLGREKNREGSLSFFFFYIDYGKKN